MPHHFAEAVSAALVNCDVLPQLQCTHEYALISKQSKTCNPSLSSLLSCFILPSSVLEIPYSELILNGNMFLNIIFPARELITTVY